MDLQKNLFFLVYTLFSEKFLSIVYKQHTLGFLQQGITVQINCESLHINLKSDLQLFGEDRKITNQDPKNYESGPKNCE